MTQAVIAALSDPTVKNKHTIISRIVNGSKKAAAAAAGLRRRGQQGPACPWVLHRLDGRLRGCLQGHGPGSFCSGLHPETLLRLLALAGKADDAGGRVHEAANEQALGEGKENKSKIFTKIRNTALQNSLHGIFIASNFAPRSPGSSPTQGPYFEILNFE